MNIVFHPAAQIELDLGFDQYELVMVGLGYRFISEVEIVIQGILLYPNAHFEIFPGVRRGLVRKFPFYVAYRVNGDVLQIVAVANHRRRPLYWAKRR